MNELERNEKIKELKLKWKEEAEKLEVAELADGTLNNSINEPYIKLTEKYRRMYKEIMES